MMKVWISCSVIIPTLFYMACEGSVYMTLDNGPGCGDKAIATPSECATAAASLGYTGKIEDIYLSWAPPGCHVGAPEDNWGYLYFNRYSNGQIGRDRYRSICHIGATPASVYMTRDNGPGCSDRSITSTSECATAAAGLGYTGTLEDIYLWWAPPGCHVGAPEDNWAYLYYNRYAYGQVGRDRYRSICHIGSTSCKSAAEWSTLTLSCNSNELINIISATYGKDQTSCLASTSLSKVKALCEGKESCNVQATNSVFGDPCSGTTKQLSICFSCEVSWTCDTFCNDVTSMSNKECSDKVHYYIPKCTLTNYSSKSVKHMWCTFYCDLFHEKGSSLYCKCVKWLANFFEPCGIHLKPFPEKTGCSN